MSPIIQATRLFLTKQVTSAAAITRIHPRITSELVAHPLGFTERSLGTAVLHHFSYNNKIQQDATVSRYLFTAKLPYMFRVSIALLGVDSGFRRQVHENGALWCTAQTVLFIHYGRTCRSHRQG